MAVKIKIINQINISKIEKSSQAKRNKLGDTKNSMAIRTMGPNVEK